MVGPGVGGCHDAAPEVPEPSKPCRPDPTPWGVGTIRFKNGIDIQ